MIDKKYIKLMNGIHNAGWTSAVIGGGFVRDTFFKRKHKDVDIFLYDPSYSNEQTSMHHNKEEMLEQMGLIRHDDMFDLNVNTDYAGSIQSAYISHVWTLETFLDPDVYQLIFVQVPPIEYVTKYFDVGICMCYFDGNRIHFTPDFMLDQKNHTLTICGKLSEQEFHKTLGAHTRTLKKKFPGFIIQVAPHLQMFVTPKVQQYINRLNKTR